ncbi:pectinesterase 1 [Olea europaea subsp. europaea]|uniref:Pectinesterase 1 n=2 Tax=Olea europaea subsp. europaea TaxID=158383 RepID=A0A8S0VIY0_OLEEU|nr:pectinesterase 1 [Olea europaea subsp. europaea]
MESSNENLKATLLNFEDQTPLPPPKTRNKKTIIFTSIILFTLIATAGILFFVQNRSTKSKYSDLYFEGSRKFYCHLTIYPDSCFSSMSLLINRSSIASNPLPIFSASLQIALTELKNSNNSISNAMISISNELSAGVSTFHKCATLLSHSLSLLNQSLATLSVDLEAMEIETLTYSETDNIKAWNMAAMAGAEDCFYALQDFESTVEIDREKIVVNEVKSKVDKARMCLANWMGLFLMKDYILDEFYNPIIVSDNYYPGYSGFDYGFILFLYCGLYLFLIVLYVMVLRGD